MKNITEEQTGKQSSQAGPRKGPLLLLSIFLLCFVYFCHQSNRDSQKESITKNYGEIVEEANRINASAPIAISDGMAIVKASYNNLRFFVYISVSDDSLFQRIANNKEAIRQNHLKGISSCEGRDLQLYKLLEEEGRSSKVFVYTNAKSQKSVEINLYHYEIKEALSALQEASSDGGVGE